MNLWENTTQADKDQLEATASNQMRDAARQCVTKAMTESMGKGDWLILGAVGVDAQKLFVRIFKEEVDALFNKLNQEETPDAGTGEQS